MDLIVHVDKDNSYNGNVDAGFGIAIMEVDSNNSSYKENEEKDKNVKIYDHIEL